MDRRNFLAALPLFGLPNKMADLSDKTVKPTSSMLLSSNSYNWITFYTREGKTWNKNLDDDFKNYKQTGFHSFEPSIKDSAEAKRLIEVLSKYEIRMPSIYIGSVLHDKTEILKATATILEIADVVKNYGTKIIVTNPNPIQWASDKLKTDEQLILQAAALENIGKELKKRDIKLAYHTHDMELKAGAREFHHMLQNTSAKHLHFCMDVHWVYRGSQNSELAVFDVLKMYGHRIIELHIRQSKEGIWQETFTEVGDIDYARFVSELDKRKIYPHLVVEQCMETHTIKTMDAYEAHRIDFKEISKTFKILLK